VDKGKSDSPPASDARKSRLKASKAGPEVSANGSTLPAGPTWVESEQDEADVGTKHILVDVALSLLEEVLREKIPDSPELQTEIVKTLQLRINSVVSDV
jgi:hypothetical protein